MCKECLHYHTNISVFNKNNFLIKNIQIYEFELPVFLPLQYFKYFITIILAVMTRFGSRAARTAREILKQSELAPKR